MRPGATEREKQSFADSVVECWSRLVPAGPQIKFLGDGLRRQLSTMPRREEFVAGMEDIFKTVNAVHAKHGKAKSWLSLGWLLGAKIIGADPNWVKVLNDEAGWLTTSQEPERPNTAAEARRDAGKSATDLAIAQLTGKGTRA